MLQTSGFRIQTYDLIDLPHRIDCSDQQDRKKHDPEYSFFSHSFLLYFPYNLI